MSIIKLILILFIIVLGRTFMTKTELNDCQELLEIFTNDSTQSPSKYVYKRLVGKSKIGLPPFSKLVQGVIVPPEKLDNLFPYDELEQFFLERITEMKNIFSKRYKENFSIYFWINFLLCLPSKILVYLGLSEENITGKILNLFFWIGSIVMAILKTSLIKHFSHLL
ncbi:hypothetical protein MEPL6_2c01610 [Melissococcus plutonius]|nr:hypothetical protein MEPL6_2c01610 [Melissococcus plutonius]